MIRFYDLRDGKLHTVSDLKSAKLVRMTAPEQDEIRRISEETSVPIDFISAACDRNERPRFENEDGVRLIIIRIPYRQDETNMPFITVALGLILTKERLITVCAVETPVMEELTNRFFQNRYSDSQLLFITPIFLSIARRYLKYLEVIRAEANDVETQIYSSLRNEMLIRMLSLEKCLVYFTTSLSGYEKIWPRLRRLEGRDVLKESEEDAIEDILIEFQQAKDLANIYSNILSGMMDAFASIISNNLNVVMKFLTSVTIILMLPTLVASFYGMNVRLPFQNSPHAFLLTIFISAVFSVIGLFWFWKNNYF